MPPPGGSAGAASGFGFSAIIASVVTSRPDTDAASSSTLTQRVPVSLALAPSCC